MKSFDLFNQSGSFCKINSLALTYSKKIFIHYSKDRKFNLGLIWNYGIEFFISACINVSAFLNKTETRIRNLRNELRLIRYYFFLLCHKHSNLKHLFWASIRFPGALTRIFLCHIGVEYATNKQWEYKENENWTYKHMMNFSTTLHDSWIFPLASLLCVSYLHHHQPHIIVVVIDYNVMVGVANGIICKKKIKCWVYIASHWKRIWKISLSKFNF